MSPARPSVSFPDLLAAPTPSTVAQHRPEQEDHRPRQGQPSKSSGENSSHSSSSLALFTCFQVCSQASQVAWKRPPLYARSSSRLNPPLGSHGEPTSCPAQALSAGLPFLLGPDSAKPRLASLLPFRSCRINHSSRALSRRDFQAVVSQTPPHSPCTPPLTPTLLQNDKLHPPTAFVPQSSLNRSPSLNLLN